MKTSLTPRYVRDSVENVVDYLSTAGLTIAYNSIAESADSVSWHATNREVPFLQSHGDIDVDQYVSWIQAGHYSCVLFDGSLLQLRYSVRNRRIWSHRLAYIPCPWNLDPSYLDGELTLDEIIDIHSDQPVRMQSPIRFDLDMEAAKPGHPAAHMTINSNDCRIACLGPITPLRFTAFIFRHFYTAYWKAHLAFFASASTSHAGEPVLDDSDKDEIHIAWNPRLRVSA